MILLLAVVAISQLRAEPLDAFRANLAAIKADVEFTYKLGRIDRSSIKGGLWGDGRPEPAEFPAQTAMGRWEYDGSVQHLVSRPRADLPRPDSHHGGLTTYQFPFEMIYDGQSVAFHPLGKEDGLTIHVMNSDRPALICRGPFMYLWPRPFPDWLGDAIPGVKPTYKTAIRGGRNTEVATYRRDGTNGYSLVEVCYDPSIGYLPRYVRFLAHATRGEKKGYADCKEMYLLDARPCAEGGFVPCEFYELSFGSKGFPADYLEVDYDTITGFAANSVSMGHFLVTKFEDRKTPVKLDHLDGMMYISGIGGTIPLGRVPQSLDLGEAKSLLGRKFSEPIKMSLPSLDSAELNRYNKPAQSTWTRSLFGVLAAILIIVLLVRWRRTRWSSAFVLMMTILTGCGDRLGPDRPVIRLSGDFAQNRIVYDPKNPWLPVTLLLKNEGDVALRIKSVAAGCSCRRVEQTAFPATIEPMATFQVPVELHDRRQFEPQSIVFTADTDSGSINVPTTIFALPSHHLSPETITLNGLDESEAGTFELVHRAIYQIDTPRAETHLDVPEDLEAIGGEISSGNVAGAPDYKYEDRSYRFKIKQRQIGLHKCVVRLEDRDHGTLIELPVVWKRLEFLSAVPDRVVLGPRPVRAFLRCPDEAVELSRVLSTPEGVKAIITSTRELTVRLTEDAPGVIAGTIEIETTAEGRAPLHIPVVRYSPPIHSSANPLPSPIDP